MTGYQYRGGKQPTTDSSVRVALVRLTDVHAHTHNVRTDLGDLRPLVASIREYGVQVPLIVERRGSQLRLRDGHRRLAAAKLAGITKAPAVIHPDALDDEEWLRSSVHLNERRENIAQADRVRTAAALRDLGVSLDGIAETFGTTVARVSSWLNGASPGLAGARGAEARSLRLTAYNHARAELIQRHRAELDQLVAEHRARLEQDATDA